MLFLILTDQSKYVCPQKKQVLKFQTKGSKGIPKPSFIEVGSTQSWDL